MSDAHDDHDIEAFVNSHGSKLDELGREVASGNRKGALGILVQLLTDWISGVPGVGSVTRIVLEKALAGPADKILDAQVAAYKEEFDQRRARILFKECLEEIIHDDVLVPLVKATNAGYDEIYRAIRELTDVLLTSSWVANRDDSPQHEQKESETLLTVIENKRVLYGPLAKRCPGDAVDSVQILRAEIQGLLLRWPRSWQLTTIARKMIKSTYRFIEYACASCEEPYSCKQCQVSKTGCIDGLQDLRAAMAHHVGELCSNFSLTPDPDRIPRI